MPQYQIFGCTIETTDSGCVAAAFAPDPKEPIKLFACGHAELVSRFANKQPLPLAEAQAYCKARKKRLEDELDAKLKAEQQAKAKAKQDEKAKAEQAKAEQAKPDKK